MWKRLSSPHRNELSIPSPAWSRAEPGEDDAAHVGLAVAVGVLEVEQVGRRAHVDAAVPAGDGGRHRHVGGEQRALVVDAVAVGVLEHPDAAPFAGRAAGPSSRAGVLVVLGELGDVEPPVLVEVDRHRAAQQRLGGDQLDVEAGPGHDRPLRLGRFLHREPGQLGRVVPGRRTIRRGRSLAACCLLLPDQRPGEEKTRGESGAIVQRRLRVMMSLPDLYLVRETALHGRRRESGWARPHRRGGEAARGAGHVERWARASIMPGSAARIKASAGRERAESGSRGQVGDGVG